jgi:pyruvate,orthophosphate dikinase
MDIPGSKFEHVLADIKAREGVTDDSQLSPEALRDVVSGFKKVYVDNGHKVISDPYEQLYAAVIAVFNSWNGERAEAYRKAEKITGLLGTGVTVQAMCFGNMGSKSGSGVCFSRNPNTGEQELFGEYLVNAQGEGNSN